MSFVNPVDALSGNAIMDLAGIHVSNTQNVATATTQDLFDVTGTILIRLIWGEVTTVLVTTTTVLLQIETGTVALSAATTVTADGDGTMYMWSGDFGAILNGTLAAGDAPIVGAAALSGGPHCPVIFGNAGASEVIETVTDQTGTGVITWHMLYTPLEIGAKATAS